MVWSCSVAQYRAEILTIFSLYIVRKDDFINSFWNLLTFKVIPSDLFNGVQELKQLTLELGSSPSAANFQNNKKLVSVELLNLDALELANNTTLSLFSHMTDLKVNLFQKPSFLHQLTHNMTRDCSLNSPEKCKFRTS